MRFSLASWLVMLIFWNLITCLMVMLDKRRARRGKWRIRERSFFLGSLLFGAAGVLIGMYMFHHKTRHRSFAFGIPSLFIGNLTCLYLLWHHGFF